MVCMMLVFMIVGLLSLALCGADFDGALPFGWGKLFRGLPLFGGWARRRVCQLPFYEVDVFRNRVNVGRTDCD